MNAGRAVFAECIGTTCLLAVVVGSGIMGERLAGGNLAVALLANAAATAAGLYVLITLLAPLSGAHLNPAVTLALRLHGERLPAPWPFYLLAQLVGAVIGTWLAHAMFELPLLQAGMHVRTGGAQGLSEAVATFGLVLTIVLGIRHRPGAIPALSPAGSSRPTGSPPAPRSPIPRSPSRERSRAASPASGRRTCRDSSLPSWSARDWPSWSRDG